MARNEEHTIQFVAKMLWKYRGAVRRAEIVERLLECDCIRRNYSKGTILNLVQQFRAWVQDPECKLAKKIPHAYMVYLNKYREEDTNFKEDIKENIEDKVEHIEELPLSEQLALVEQAKGNLEKANEDYQNELEEAIQVLTEKLNTAKLIFAEKHYEYETVIANIKKAIVWQEMMK
jgi:hypothetical protein